MKQFLATIALLVFFAVPTFSFSIMAPEKVVSFSSWSFGVEFELLDSFQSAAVSLDGKKLATVYPNNQVLLDPFNGFQAIKATALDRKLFVSVVGLDAGEHVLLVETLNDSGAVLGSKTRTIRVIEPLAAGYKEEVQAELGVLKSQNDSLRQQLEAVKQSNGLLEEKIAQQQQLLEQQKTELETLAQLSNWLQENQNSTTVFNESSAKQLQSVETRLAEQEQQQQNAGNSVTGLVSQPGQFSGGLPTILGLLMLLVISGYAILRHAREKKLY